MSEQSWVFAAPDGQEYIVEVWRGQPKTNAFLGVHVFTWLARRLRSGSAWQLRVTPFPVRGLGSLVKERVPHDQVGRRVGELKRLIVSGVAPDAWTREGGRTSSGVDGRAARRSG